MEATWIGLLVAAFIVGAVAGCAGLSSAGGIAKQAPRRDMLVSTAWLWQRLGDRHVVVAHVGKNRTVYDAGHVPGARFVAWMDVAVTRDGLPNQLPPLADLVALVRRLGIAQDDRVVLYDEEGGLWAARVYVALDYVGLGDRVALLDGHLKKWVQEQRALSREQPQGEASSYVPRPRPEVLVSLTAVRDIVWARTQVAGSPAAILDARPAPQYLGADPGEGIKRPGHIPGAVNVFWQRHLLSTDSPVLRSESELRALYAEAGVRPDDVVVAYCRTGVQASHTCFVLKYLGYDVRLYDGSYSEWSAAPDTPIASGASP